MIYVILPLNSYKMITVILIRVRISKMILKHNYIHVFYSKKINEMLLSAHMLLLSPGNSYWRGRFSTVHLLLLTCLAAFDDASIIFFYKTRATSKRRSSALSLPVLLVFRALFWLQNSLDILNALWCMLTTQWPYKFSSTVQFVILQEKSSCPE